MKIKSNASKIIVQLKKQKKSMETKRKRFLERLFEEGVMIADVKLSTIQYDGPTHNLGVDAEPHWLDNNKLALSIKGDEITFIEFGTGTYYPDQHELAGEGQFANMIRGEFGKGKGANPPWRYTNADTGETRQKTYGNPPNRVAYGTAKELRQKIAEIAKEVYGE